MDQALRDRDWAGFASRYNGRTLPTTITTPSSNLPRQIFDRGDARTFWCARVQVPSDVQAIRARHDRRRRRTRTMPPVKAFQISAGDVPDGHHRDALLADLAKD